MEEKIKRIRFLQEFDGGFYSYKKGEVHPIRPFNENFFFVKFGYVEIPFAYKAEGKSFKFFKSKKRMG